MNIIQVGPYPLDALCIKGGIESSVYGLANALSKNHTVDVFDFPRLNGKDTCERVDSVHIHRYANHWEYNQDNIYRVDEILRDIIALHPDIVHIHGTGKISSVIYQALKQYGLKVLLTVHGLLHVEKQNLLRKSFRLKHLYQYFYQSKTEFEVLSCTEKIIVDTEYVATQIKQLYQKGKIRHLPQMYTIPQGINSKFLSLTTNPQENYILSVGAISERKGHLYLLQAFEKVCTSIPTAKLVIAGSLTEDQYYDQLLKYIEKSAYKENISIYPNLLQEDLFKLYQEAKIFALHTQEESQGIVFAEAMAVGLPIVSTTVGGVPYVVQEAKNGLLCSYGDTTTMANMIIQLLGNEEKYQSFSLSSRNIAEQYDWQNIASQIEILYSQI